VALFREKFSSVMGKKNNFLTMDINRTYEADLADPTPAQHLSRAESSFATSTALSLLIQIENTRLLALFYSPWDFQARFPHDRVPLCARGVIKHNLQFFLDRVARRLREQRMNRVSRTDLRYALLAAVLSAAEFVDRSAAFSQLISLVTDIERQAHCAARPVLPSFECKAASSLTMLHAGPPKQMT
tara:strand:+ start:693 stop:1250 length:558 start_codon:yes stop_codon:yes gene_type:complete